MEQPMQKTRSYFLDNVKWCLITNVLLFHLWQAFGGSIGLRLVPGITMGVGGYNDFHSALCEYLFACYTIWCIMYGILYIAYVNSLTLQISFLPFEYFLCSNRLVVWNAVSDVLHGVSGKMCCCITRTFRMLTCNILVIVAFSSSSVPIFYRGVCKRRAVLSSSRNVHRGSGLELWW